MSTPTTTAAAGAVDALKVYGTGDASVTALNHVSVTFTPGHFTAIMGPSGSGKSTLMHCLAGLDDLTYGDVFIGDTHLADLNDRQLTELRRTKVGFIFQAFNLIPTLTAKENILFPLTLGGRDVDEAWFDEVVTTVGLADRLTHRPSELSGGQQQRVAIARAARVGGPRGGRLRARRRRHGEAPGVVERVREGGAGHAPARRHPQQGQRQCSTHGPTSPVPPRTERRAGREGPSSPSRG